MQRMHLSIVFAVVIAAFVWFAAGGPASAQTQTLFGSLSNFDCFNDTGQETHGFEIELDGISSADVVYTFGSPYQFRYGTPVLVNFTGGVYVRYQSPYDPVRKIFTGTTPIPPSITPTAGHACWTGGSAGYLTAGCEHFGVSLARNATATKYRWLVADPLKPGALKAFGTNVSIPAPVWTVAPPAVPGAAPIVAAVIPPQPVPPEAPEGRFGDALWVKTYETELPDQVALNHLVTDDAAVPQEQAEVETEWEISQANPGVPDGGALEHGKPLGGAKQSVVRRYEFYKYTGAYDPDTHEVMCGGDGSCNTPLPGELGNYIRAQMGVIHIAPANLVPAVQVTSSGFVFSRATRTYIGTVSVKNTGGQDVAGPLMIVFSNLQPGVAVVNPTGKFQANPYLVLPSVGAAGTKLTRNQSVSFSVQFTATGPISFTANVYSGGM